jgi:hypothetical protein
MAGPITGVNPITGFVISQPEAPPFQQQGGPVDIRHGGPLVAPEVPPWLVIPMGPYPNVHNPYDDALDESKSYAGMPAGYLSQDKTADLQPDTRAAPFPEEGPGSPTGEQVDVSERHAGSTRQLIQSAWIHAQGMGGGLKRLFMPQMLAKQDEWTGFYNKVQGDDIVPNAPGAIGHQAGGIGVNDHTSNKYAKINAYELNTSHRHRRFATGPIPGNFMWMKPGGRPMVRSLTGMHNFPTSGAFENDDPGATFSYQGAVLQNVPSEYVAPPQPSLQPAAIGTDSAPQSIPEISFY